MSEDTKPLMSERTKTGLEILQAAVLLGISGDALLRCVPPGLNVLLWMLVFVTGTAALLARHRANLYGFENKLFFIPLLAFAAFFAWRDSNVLALLDALVILLTLAIITLRGQNISVRVAGVFQYGLGVFLTVVNAMFAPFYLLLGDIKWATIPRAGWTKHLFSVLRGLMVAVPILLVFGGLFMAADAVFEGVVRQTFNIDPLTIITHAFLIAFFAWTSAGFLRGAIIKSEILNAAINSEKSVENEKPAAETKSFSIKDSPLGIVEKVIHQSDEPAKQKEDFTEKPQEKLKNFFSLGLTEVSVILGLMNLLFLSFVVIQIRYFFGGAQFVQQIAGMTYADYARRGFFELVWVAALVLPILLAVHYLLRKDNPRNEQVFRFLAGGQIVLLFVIMASAVSRMFLYQNEYGLTELRVYTTAFMFWLATVFVIFAATVLIGRRERFAFGAYLSALFVVVALQFINPDALIVKTNLSRMNEGKFFDARYAASLSADAIPFLINEFPAINGENRCTIENKLLERKKYEANKDWRSWNFSRATAWRLVESEAENWNVSGCPKEDFSREDAF